MKLLWLTAAAVLVGMAAATEEEVDSLQSLDSRTFNLTLPTSTTAITTDPLLIIGNIISFLAGLTPEVPTVTLNLTNPDFLGLTNGLGVTGGAPIDLGALAGGLGGLGAGAAGLTGLSALVSATLAIFSSVKNALLYFPLKGLEIANFILAIIGLAFLGIFLAGGGDVGGLIGTDLTGFGSDLTGFGADLTGFLRRDSSDSHDSYSYYTEAARSLYDSTAVQTLTQLVYDAIMKYSN